MFCETVPHSVKHSFFLKGNKIFFKNQPFQITKKGGILISLRWLYVLKEKKSRTWCKKGTDSAINKSVPFFPQINVCFEKLF